jgi:hypothetical protein
MTTKGYQIDKEGIVDFYMAYVEKEGFDGGMSHFCDSTGIDSADVLNYFSSLTQIEKYVWEQMMASALATIMSDGSFEGFSQRDKLLSLYYTFFENCTLNRDFLLASIGHHGIYRILPVWDDMKHIFAKFIIEVFQSNGSIKSPYCADEIDRFVDRAKGESFWAQLLFLIDFWRHDESEDLEKTDIAIEKSVKATMDLIDVTPIKSIFDLGKFIWKERINKAATD